MGITWKDLERLEKKNHEDYLHGIGDSSLSWSEVTRLLYCARKLKEAERVSKKK